LKQFHWVPRLLLLSQTRQQTLMISWSLSTLPNERFTTSLRPVVNPVKF
jgi:hypothetical protein